MGSIISFEERAVAALRERLGAAEEARADLIAFARGHQGATAAIHEAVLAMLAEDGLEAMAGVITNIWPSMLGVDHVALALIIDGDGFRFDKKGVFAVERPWVERAVEAASPVLLRPVDRGDPLFGPDGRDIRSEALVRVGGGRHDLPQGALLLGQAGDVLAGSRQGDDLLFFLGRSLDAMLMRWLRNR